MGKRGKAVNREAPARSAGASSFSSFTRGALLAAGAVTVAAVLLAHAMESTPPPQPPLRKPPAKRATPAEVPRASQSNALRESRPSDADVSKATPAAPARRRGTVQPPPEPGCGDIAGEGCPNWANSGECDANPEFMHKQCKWSCGLCRGGVPPKKRGDCEDTNANCATWASIGECESNPGFMKVQCPVTCRLCQSADCKDEFDDCADRVRGPAESNF